MVSTATNDRLQPLLEIANILSHVYQVVSDLRTRLTRSQRALAAWRKCVPHSPALPLSKPLILTIVGILWRQGRHHSAIAISTAWGAYHRASETINLTTRDVALPSDARLWSFSQTKVAGISIKDGKTGDNQFTVIRAAKCFHCSLPTYPQCQKARSFRSDIKYLSDIKNAATELGISGSLPPHSARIGRALHDYINGMEAETIALHGRWKFLSSLSYYLTNGISFSQTLQLTSGQQNAISCSASFTNHLATNTHKV